MTPTTRITSYQAAAWARIALQVLDTPYPYSSAHVATGPEDTDITPQRLHPAFHGALDWHSSVHMQWSLTVLATRHPEALAAAGELTAVQRLLDERLTEQALATEVAYLRARPGFERPYGWAWALMLASELLVNQSTTQQVATRWGEPMQPLADLIIERVLAWLPLQTYPVRHGKHANDAFALRLLHEAGQRMGRTDLTSAVAAKSREWFLADTAWDTRDEPGGSDFLSPALTVADLMREVLPAAEFTPWLAAFLPGLGEEGSPHAHLLALPAISDSTDGQLAHLWGLSLSRAWQLRALAPWLPSAAGDRCQEAAQKQVEAVLPTITDGDFMATHCLVSFALLAAGSSSAEGSVAEAS